MSHSRIHGNGVSLVTAVTLVVVPREKAKEAAEYARGIMEGDKAGRRNLYKKLGSSGFSVLAG